LLGLKTRAYVFLYSNIVIPVKGFENGATLAMYDMHAKKDWRAIGKSFASANIHHTHFLHSFGSMGGIISVTCTVRNKGFKK
jgi:hypothetical protein